MAKLTIEEREKLLKLKSEELKLEKKGRELTEDKRKELEKLVSLENSLAESSTRKLERLKQQSKRLEEIVSSLEAQKQAGVDIGNIYDDQLEKEEAILEYKAAQLAKAKEIDKEAINANLRAQEELRIRKQGASDAEGILKRMTGITKTPTSLLGKIGQNPGAYMKGTMGGMKGLVSGASIVTSTLDKVVEATVAMAIEQDSAVVQFNRATGASGAFDAQIRQTNVDLRFSGVTAAEASQAYQDLFTNVSDFTLMTEKEQMTLSKTTSILNELGISSKDTAANIQLATKALGMSVTQAEYLVRDLATFAKELGVSTAQLSADFSRMAPMITELGTDGVQAFRSLQREAKATGIDINRLYGITSKFDTFDAAAQSVGKLNAMLGGPFLNTMDMVMEEDPAERMRMLKDSVDQAGLSFDTMSKFQRKALAEAMGLNDASELALVLRGREDLLPGGEKSAEDIEAMAARTAQFNTIADEFKQIMMGFAIALGPTVSMLKNMLQFIQPMIPYLGAIGGALAVVGAALGFLNPVSATIMAIVGGLTMISQWWEKGFSTSGEKTFKAMKISTMEVTAATKDMNTVQQSGIAGTTAATGMPAATAMANTAATSGGRQGPIILEVDGRTLARETDRASNKTIGTKLVRRYA